MKRVALLLMGAVFALSAACTGGGGDDDDDVATALDPGEYAIEINAPPHANQVASFRIRQGGTVSCVSGSLNGAGVATLTTGGLTVGNSYNRVELVLNLDGNDQWNDGVDHVFSHPTISVTTGILFSFDHANPAAGGWEFDAVDLTSPPQGWSWTDGAACPGT